MAEAGIFEAVKKKPTKRRRPEKDKNGKNREVLPYLAKLVSDANFVKSCLRDKALWCKLSEEEKEYCKKRKEEWKREKLKRRQE